VDKSATGSVNFFGPDRSSRISRVLPAFDRGVTSFVWALVFGLFIWIGGSAVGYGSAMSFVVGCVAAFLIFLFVRVYGEDEPRRP
jgi:hypothetical protein